MAIDWNKPIRTRDGKRARLACERKHERLPMVVLIDRGQFESVEGYTKDGHFNLDGEESSFDLVNYETVTIPECWVIYTPKGVRTTSTSCSDTAADYAKDGFIVRHIPAEEREV